MLPSDGSLPGLSSFIPYGGPPTSAFQIVDADPGGVDELIRTRGTTVDYWKSIVCPCTRTESGRHRRVCPVCLGAGYAYPPDLRCEGIKILLSSHQQNRKNTDFGDIQQGTSTATFPESVTPQKGDLIFPRGQTHVVDELLLRGNNPLADTVATRRRSDLVSAVVHDAPDDALRYPKVTAIRFVYGWNPDAMVEKMAEFNAASLAGLQPGQQAAAYTAGLPRYYDWELVDGNLIRWKPGTGPTLGTAYLVKYEAPATYMISDDAGYRSDGDTRLQRKPSSLTRYDAVGHDLRLRGVV